MPDTGKIKENMRDIQLICVGYGLHKDCRKQLLGELPQGTCCHEVEELLRCFRTGRPDELITWLGSRQVHVADGKEIIQAITDKINEQHKSAKLQKVLAHVKFAAQLESPDEVIADLKEAIAELEKM